MGKVETYRDQLRALDPAEWDQFLLAKSGLPGPRGNIELARAAAAEGDEVRFKRYLAIDADRAPANTPDEFLAFCGVLGLGRLIAEGQHPIEGLRRFANDPRWRLREAVAIALQGVGQTDLGRLQELRSWAEGTYLEQRAAAAGLCEPCVLVSGEACILALDVLDSVTEHIQAARERDNEDFRTLRKGMAYCWSVVVASCPEAGKSHFERWLDGVDKDIRWVMRENLKKKRLLRLDEAWVERCQHRLDSL